MDLYELIELGDIDELLREVDRLCERRSWAELLRLRDLCRAATQRGKQLWGVAGHAEYRLALEAPAEFAAPMVEAEPGRFVLGPLTEVVASTHTWAELAPHLPLGPMRTSTAYERVMRGENLRSDEVAASEIDFGLPLALQPWEPAFAPAEYRSHELRAPMPDFKAPEWVEIRRDIQPAGEIEDPATDALARLVSHWVAGSNGEVEVIAVDGGLDGALSHLEIAAAGRLDAGDALAWMGWAAASGGAHAFRPGAAAGRAKTWWALANLAQVAGEWPYPADELGAYAGEVEWWTWPQNDMSKGWSLRLAIVDPASDATFIIDASDRSS
jgi:hypothetical protein